MKENIKDNTVYVAVDGDVELLGKRFLNIELENKLNRLENTIDAIGFFSLFNLLILTLYISTKGF